MSQNSAPAYVHRRNRDGTFDSICSKCAATVISASVEADLRDGEQKHICDQDLLEARRKHSIVPPASKPADTPDT